MRRKKIKLILMIVLILLPLSGSLFIPNNPNHVDVSKKFSSSSHAYLLGTDNLGRCEFSRLLVAGNNTIKIVLAASLIIFAAGTCIGLFMSGKKQESLHLMMLSLLDSVTAIPTIIYLVIIVGILGNGIFPMIMALTISLILRLIKFVMVLSEDEQKKAYCICAKCLGASDTRLLFFHILPNILHRIFSYISLSCAEMIMLISAFSFIGISLGDEKIDWGLMLNEGRNFFSVKPSLALLPMALIIIYSFVFNALAKIIKEIYSYD